MTHDHTNHRCRFPSNVDLGTHFSPYKLLARRRLSSTPTCCCPPQHGHPAGALHSALSPHSATHARLARAKYLRSPTPRQIPAPVSPCHIRQHKILHCHIRVAQIPGGTELATFAGPTALPATLAHQARAWTKYFDVHGMASVVGDLSAVVDSMLFSLRRRFAAPNIFLYLLLLLLVTTGTSTLRSGYAWVMYGVLRVGRTPQVITPGHDYAFTSPCLLVY